MGAVAPLKIMEILDYLELSLIKGVGNKTLKTLLENLKSPKNIFSSTVSELSKFIPKKQAEIILKRDKSYRIKAERELKVIEKKNIKLTHINDRQYPSILKEIPDPPIILYYLGDITILDKNIAIVGSRRYSSYGKVITEKFSSELAENGINIVSGLALGIDSIAHKSALKVKGKTTAVLGNGIDIIYPYENKKLFEEIKEEGCIISEFPIGTTPSKYTFPQRNRVIAGLSYGVIITEAPEKSGALITASYGLEYNRIIFSIPTNITNPYGKGSNNLLKEGAFPLTDIEDIYKELTFLKLERKEQIVNLSSVEKNILKNLSKPTHIDDLVLKTGLEMDKLIEILFEMEMKELISNENGLIIAKIF